jgi:hypothetical protein
MLALYFTADEIDGAHEVLGKNGMKKCEAF